MEMPQINIVIPLFNEEKIFPLLLERLKRLIENSPLSIQVIMVDDGSTDQTTDLISAASMKDDRFHSVFLSRNFGHQSALSAGLRYVNATEAVLIVDGDLQDPPELLPVFYDHFLKGKDVVYGVRKKRKESLLKRIAYKLFYRIMRNISNINIPLDSGDFALLGRVVVDRLNAMPEESRFLRGMRAWVGFKQVGVEYERDKRQAGDSKYSFGQLLKLAYNGIFNFSEYPIKAIFTIGAITMMVAGVYLLYAVIDKFFFDGSPEGFTALLFTIIMFGGVHLIALSIIGEYVLRIFFQVKKRPLFIVKERIFNQKVLDE